MSRPKDNARDAMATGRLARLTDRLPWVRRAKPVYRIVAYHAVDEDGELKRYYLRILVGYDYASRGTRVFIPVSPDGQDIVEPGEIGTIIDKPPPPSPRAYSFGYHWQTYRHRYAFWFWFVNLVLVGHLIATTLNPFK